MKTPFTMKLRVERDDTLPAFAGFFRREDGQCTDGLILLNVEATFSGGCYEDGTPVKLSKKEKKRQLICHLMHEFGHAMEVYFALPVNEAAIERACEEYESLKPRKKR